MPGADEERENIKFLAMVIRMNSTVFLNRNKRR